MLRICARRMTPEQAALNVSTMSTHAESIQKDKIVTTSNVKKSYQYTDRQAQRGESVSIRCKLCALAGSVWDIHIHLFARQ